MKFHVEDGFLINCVAFQERHKGFNKDTTTTSVGHTHVIYLIMTKTVKTGKEEEEDRQSYRGWDTNHSLLGHCEYTAYSKKTKLNTLEIKHHTINNMPPQAVSPSKVNSQRQPHWGMEDLTNRRTRNKGDRVLKLNNLKSTLNNKRIQSVKTKIHNTKIR